MKKKIKESERFVNRDISWLAFNSRVLFEALDSGNPLLERLKFLSIFSSNLDEFFMVRVAEIARQDPKIPQKIYKTCSYLPGELLKKMETEIRQAVTRQYRTLNEKILPALRENGIHLLFREELSAAHRKTADGIFSREILPVLTPIGIDPSHPFPLVPNLALELLIRLRKNGQERFAVLEVPSQVPRFVLLEDSHGENGRRLVFTAAEEIISNNLEQLFRGCEILECAPFRITRDMDFSIDEESVADLVSEMEVALRKNTKRSVVRLEAGAGMSLKSRRWLMEKLCVESHQVYVIPGYLNLKNMFQIASLPDFPHLSDIPMQSFPSARIQSGTSMFENIRENGPILLHHPYESFEPVIRLIEEAADDPDVLAIKQTLYRVSRNSPVVNALVRAARNGKQVSVLFEIKARFDEENNIRGARELAEAGAHVVYGVAGLKVHCKALLIVRREASGIRRYVHLSTGNYNERTARQYTDLGYFSDDDLLARDVAGLFNVITGFSDPPEWSRLLVAPFTLKDKLIFMIDREANLSAPGNPGHIVIKVNSILDYEVIEHLYQAAEQGVKIDLIVRGICGVNPYALAPEAARNFRIVSILDRFLEHARIYRFANNGNPDYYIGSADVMPRNLRRRIETLFPISDPGLRDELDYILDCQLNDMRKGRRVIAENVYSSTRSMQKYETSRSQYVLYDHYRQLHADAEARAGVRKGRLAVFRESRFRN